MQHNSVNPYIVALNTEMFQNSRVLPDPKAAEDGWVQSVLNRGLLNPTTVQLASELKNKLSACLILDAKYDLTAQIRQLAYEMTRLLEELNSESRQIYWNKCYTEIQKYVLGEERANKEREEKEARIAAADKRLHNFRAEQASKSK